MYLTYPIVHYFLFHKIHLSEKTGKSTYIQDK